MDLQTALHIAIIVYLVLRDVVMILKQIITQMGGTIPPDNGSSS